MRAGPFPSWLVVPSIEGRVVGRVVSAGGRHQWRTEFPSPHAAEQLWYSTAQLQLQIQRTNSITPGLTAPPRSAPTPMPLRDFSLKVDGSPRTSHHSFVGLVVCVRLQTEATARAQAPRGRSPPIPLHKAAIEEVFVVTSNAGPCCWGRVHADTPLSAILNNVEILGAH